MADGGLFVQLAQDAPVPLDLAFECAPGRVVALFGPSGSGKTTIVRAIAGVHRTARGRVSVGGETWLDTSQGRDLPARRRAVGVVFQDYALFPHLTALGNVLMALGHAPAASRPGRARDLLRLVSLENRAGHLPAALSGGEQQRVAIARALARDPRVLLLDEPFAAVDRPLRRALHAAIDDARRTLGIPVVLVTHDFEDVVRLATDLVILHGGRAVASGPLDALTSRPDLPWLRDSVGLGVVLDARVAAIDGGRGLAVLDVDGASLVAPADGLETGARVRLRVPARDVILASSVPEGLSVHNALAATVTRVEPDAARRVAVVQLRVGQSLLLAEVTTDAVDRMRVVAGAPIYALVKSVSLQVVSA